LNRIYALLLSAVLIQVPCVLADDHAYNLIEQVTQKARCATSGMPRDDWGPSHPTVPNQAVRFRSVLCWSMPSLALARLF